MLNATVLATCRNCPGVKALKAAAEAEGYEVSVDVVVCSDDRTRKSAELGIGLPVLVREDGAMSDDGITWRGEIKKTRKKVTHPVDKVVDSVDKGVSDADNNFFE